MMPIAWIIGIAIMAIQGTGAQCDPCISENDIAPISIEELKDHFDKYDGKITKISGRLSVMQYGTSLSDLENDEWIVVKSGKSSTADVHFNVCEDKLYESLSEILYESSIPRPPELFKKPLPSYVVDLIGKLSVRRDEKGKVIRESDVFFRKYPLEFIYFKVARIREIEQ